MRGLCFGNWKVAGIGDISLMVAPQTLNFE